MSATTADRARVAADIAKHTALTPEGLEAYLAALRFVDVAPKDHLHEIGRVCDRAFFVLEGCMRYYNLSDGEEHTGQFFFEGAWYSDYGSFLFGEPSDQGIQALERMRVAVLSKANLERLYVEVPAMERFGRIMAETAFLGLRRRTVSLTQLSARERYARLLATRPHVLRRVPQKYIASYLNIRPQSLSRIRAAMK